MSINLTVPEMQELKPRITVFGVGGAGGNAVNNMIESQLDGVEFVVANTDAQALTLSRAERRIQMGVNVTQGLGAGSRPEIGQAAAEEAIEEIMDHLSGSHMIFITAGMGGGTGTGAAPVIARAAQEMGVLTVGVVTKPFQFEGGRRMRVAEAGIDALQQFVDTLLIIPNQNLFRVANERTTFAEAFAMADQVLHSGVRGITDLMVAPGLINLDFADVRAVMSEMGKAMMGTGEAEGEKRALDAAEAAIANPLLDDVSMKGAKGVLINITGGMDLTLFEVDEAANRIRSEVDPEANIIVGSTFAEELEGRMRVSVVATGIEAEENAERPADASSVVQFNRTMPQRSPSTDTAPAAGSRQGGGVHAGAAAVARVTEGEVTPRSVDEAPVMTAAASALAELQSTEIAEPRRQGSRSLTMAEAAKLAEEELARDEAEADLASGEDEGETETETAVFGRRSSLPKSAGPEGATVKAGREATTPPVSAHQPGEQPFIAPKPTLPPRPAQSSSAPAAATRQAVPDAERSTEYGPKAKRRGPTLLERMTGVGRARRASSQDEAAAPERTSAEPKPAAAPRSETPEPSKAPASESGLRASPDDRLTPPPLEDDQLEIPAFLRRQAN